MEIMNQLSEPLSSSLSSITLVGQGRQSVIAPGKLDGDIWRMEDLMDGHNIREPCFCRSGTVTQPVRTEISSCM